MYNSNITMATITRIQRKCVGEGDCYYQVVGAMSVTAKYAESWQNQEHKGRGQSVFSPHKKKSYIFLYIYIIITKKKKSRSLWRIIVITIYRWMSRKNL